MKLRIKDQAELCCAKCRKKIIVKSKDVRYETDVCAFRSMGAEIQHNLGYCDNCPHCNLVYYFNIDAYEYPSNCINYIDYETNGASWWQNNKPVILDENNNVVEYDCRRS